MANDGASASRIKMEAKEMDVMPQNTRDHSKYGWGWLAEVFCRMGAAGQGTSSLYTNL
jgi:hypothetical protein